ncbi:MAG TPA: DUF6111 family protein [Stellaceae bacterium]|nr:DUF6111 family protein [Stellaceae bacterium]
MFRVLLTIVLPLILPTALYLLWLRLRAARLAHAGEAQGALRWAALPWVWLAAAGVVLLAVVLFVVTVHFGTSQPGVYVPPHWENGQIVPGHIEPAKP